MKQARTMKPKRKTATRSPFATIDQAIEAIREGKMIIVVDDEDRENEGDLTIAAEKVTPEAINFMARYGRGLICMPMTGVPELTKFVRKHRLLMITIADLIKYRMRTERLVKGIAIADLPTEHGA